MIRPLLVAALVVVGAAACDDQDDDDPIGPGGDLGAPELLEGAGYTRGTWAFEGFIDGEAIGHPAVELYWTPPEDWSAEPFRVYSRPAGGGGYVLVATVTSCLGDALCRYTDIDVSPGTSYDYYVVAVDERSGQEFTESDVVRVEVPGLDAPDAPEAPRVVALDGALYLTWSPVGAQIYRIFLENPGGEPFFIGETDGTGYLDERAENGELSSYRIAALNEDGPVSDLSAAGVGIPRPDYHSEIAYAYGDNAALSGFRFATSDAEDPILPGDDTDAQWRLEVVGGALSIRPLGQTRVTTGEFTTSLSCGPGSEEDCVSVETAPSASAFQSSPVAVDPGFTYVFQVVGDDGDEHYGKVRVQGSGVNADGDLALVFDWAYQLRAEEPSLSVGRD